MDDINILCSELQTILRVEYKPKKGETQVSFWLRMVGEALVKEGKLAVEEYKKTLPD